MRANRGRRSRRPDKRGEAGAPRREELARRTVDVSVGGDMVRMTFNGKGEAVSIHIAPEVVDRNDVRMLEDLVLSAVNEGVRRSQKLMQEEMAKLTGGLNIPGVTS